MLPKSKDRILLINYEMSYTGSPRALYNLAKIFIDLGKDVSVYTINSGPFENEFKKLNIEVKEVSLKDVSLGSKMLEKFELVVCNTIFCLDIAYAIQDKVKTVLYIMEANNLRQLMRDCDLDFQKLKRIKTIFCVSEYAKNAIQEVIENKNVFVVHNYIDKYKSGIKFVNPKCIKFVVSGTIEHRKAQEIALKAINTLDKDVRKKCELHILGDIPIWSKEYSDRLLNLKIDNVYFHDAINDTKSLYMFYKKMDVFLIPSRDESCSLVALEAAMLKRPIIVSENVGAKYLINTKENVVPVDDYKSLARCISTYIEKPLRIYIDGIKCYISYLKFGTYRFVKKEILKIMRDVL